MPNPRDFWIRLNQAYQIKYGRNLKPLLSRIGRREGTQHPDDRTKWKIKDTDDLEKALDGMSIGEYLEKLKTHDGRT